MIRGPRFRGMETSMCRLVQSSAAVLDAAAVGSPSGEVVVSLIDDTSLGTAIRFRHIELTH